MNLEQNDPMASEPRASNPSEGSAEAAPTQAVIPGTGQGRRRRRRRRNKAKAGQAANGQGGQPAATNGGGESQQQAPVMEQRPPQQQQQPKKQFNRPYKNNGGQNNNGNGGGYSNNGNGGYSQSGHYGNGGGQKQGGGRRKNKQGRRQQPTFVGPMDHSYRMVNGNVADSSHQNHNYEFRGMPHSGFYGEQDVFSMPHSGGPIAEDAPVRIYFFLEDLFFVAKIGEAARKLGIKVEFAKAEKETLAKITDASEEERPSLIVFDLNNASAKPLTVIPKLKAKLKRGTSIIGFLSQIQGDLKLKAIEAGCDTVMARSAFSQNLPNLLRRHGLDEELETLGM